MNGCMPMVGSEGPRFLFGEGAAAVVEVNIVRIKAKVGAKVSS